MLIIALGVLAALFIAAGVIDFRARRRKMRYRGVDAKAVHDRRYGADAADAQMRSRVANQGDNGSFFGGGF